MSTDRLFTEKEIGAILRRAGEMQADQGVKETQGLSMKELQQIAAEVGLDPKLVAAAVAEMNQGTIKDGGFSWTGAPVKLQMERVVSGEASTEQWAELAAEIGQAFGLLGTSAQVGRTLEWTHTSRRIQLQVTVTPGEGQTKVRVHGNFTRLAAVAFLPFTIVSFIYGVMFSAAGGLPIPAMLGIGLGAMMLVYMVIRFGYGTYFRKKERAAGALLQQLETMIAAGETTAQGQMEASAQRLEIPGAEKDVGAAAVPERKRTRG